MYDFHYNFIKRKLMLILFTHTDSLTYEIKSKDVYEELFEYKYLFDCIEFQSNFLIQLTKELIANER